MLDLAGKKVLQRSQRKRGIHYGKDRFDNGLSGLRQDDIY